MILSDIKHWLEEEFRYPVPKDYMDFLIAGDFETTWRKIYVISEDEGVLEISDWFGYDNLILAYNSCLEEEMIETFHLPMFDSCNCTVVLDCNIKGDSYGAVFLRTPEGYFDEGLNKNVYTQFNFVAKNFSEIINNLITDEELNK